jgi:hypothetical protein
MEFCDHCEGQRFDRAQVLRTLRALRRQMRDAQCGKPVDDALATALKAVADLDIPHLYFEEEIDQVVH